MFLSIFACTYSCSVGYISSMSFLYSIVCYSFFSPACICLEQCMTSEIASNLFYSSFKTLGVNVLEFNCYALRVTSATMDDLKHFDGKKSVVNTEVMFKICRSVL